MLEDWTIEQPVEFVAGGTYIVKANHIKGFWAKLLIEILEKEDEFYRFKILTLLDGSPGMLEGYLGE